MESSLKTKGILELARFAEEAKSRLVIPGLGINYKVKWLVHFDLDKTISISPKSQKFLRNTGIIHYLELEEFSENDTSLQSLGIKPIDGTFVLDRFDEARKLKRSFNLQYTFLDEYKKEIEHFSFKANVLNDFSKMLENEIFTDVVLQCKGGGEVKAHRCILSVRSEYFEKMFTSETVESKSLLVDCSFERDVMVSLLEFIYSGKIDENKVKDLIEPADYYGLTSLKTTCEDILFSKLNIENAVSTFVFADIHGCSELKQRTLKFIGTNFKEVAKQKEMLQLPNAFGILNLRVELIQELFESFVD